MNLDQLLAELYRAGVLGRSPKDQQNTLVKVAIPGDYEVILGDDSVVKKIPVYKHFNIEDVKVVTYRDSGEENKVLYIRTKEE